MKYMLQDEKSIQKNEKKEEQLLLLQNCAKLSEINIMVVFVSMEKGLHQICSATKDYFLLSILI
jgi:hypothetical protein